jgi:hypothetical protein
MHSLVSTTSIIIDKGTILELIGGVFTMLLAGDIAVNVLLDNIIK